MSGENFNQFVSYHRSSEEISLKDLIKKIRRIVRFLITKWKIILAIQLMGATIGVIYSTLKKTTYTAITTFVLDDASSSKALLGQYSGLASMMGVDVGGNDGIFQGDNIIELYRSRNMIQRAY